LCHYPFLVFWHFFLTAHHPAPLLIKHGRLEHHSQNITTSADFLLRLMVLIHFLSHGTKCFPLSNPSIRMMVVGKDWLMMRCTTLVEAMMEYSPSCSISLGSDHFFPSEAMSPVTLKPIVLFNCFCILLLVIILSKKMLPS
jgi:hypothetical protein